MTDRERAGTQGSPVTGALVRPCETLGRWHRSASLVENLLLTTC